MAQSKSTQKSSAILERENSQLKAEIANLQKRLNTTNSQPKTIPKSVRSWKPYAAWSAVILAGVLLILGNLFFWAGNTIVDTNKYVATVGPLIQKPEIQSAIAAYTTSELYKQVNVSSYIQQVLPPRADFLAPQLSSQIKNYTQSTIKTLLANQKVQAYWYSSLERRHQALISFSKSYQGNGTITVSDIYSELSKRLATTNLSFLANKTLPSKVGSITVATAGWLPILHNLVNNIGLYQTIATLLLIILCGLAIYLSVNRRRMVVRIGIMFALFMLALLISIRIAGTLIVSRFNPDYQSAISVAYSTVTHFLIIQVRTVLLLFAIIAFIAWLNGPSRVASIVRVRFNDILSGHLHQSIFGNHETPLTLWLSIHKRLMQWLSILLIAVIVLIVQLSPKLIILYGLLLLVLIAAIEILAAPKAAVTIKSI